MEKLEKLCQEITDELNVRCNLTSQHIVAKKSGVGRSYISQLLNGERDVAGLTLRKLFQLLPECEVSIHGRNVATILPNENQITTQLHAYIDTLTPPQQKKALELLKIAFTDNDKPTK